MATFAVVGVIATALAGAQILFDVPLFGAKDEPLQQSAVYVEGKQYVEAPVTTSGFTSVMVQRDIPCVINFSVDIPLDACNDEIVLPQYDVDMMLSQGDNIMEIYPDEVGAFNYTCGHGHCIAKVMVCQSLGFDGSEIAGLPVADETSESTTVTYTESGESDIPDLVLEEKNDSLADWVKNQMTPGSESDGNAREIKTWSGWLFDRCCIGIDPFNHTKSCNLMGGCLLSGLGIIPYEPDRVFDTYTALDDYLNFDGSSKALAEEFLRQLPDSWKYNVTVKVTGYVVNNIPASADEITIPETDESKIDHYLTGIHITRIEAAYIDGLSTNTLPEPNLVFTQQ